jgi:hypothetical protein
MTLAGLTSSVISKKCDGRPYDSIYRRLAHCGHGTTCRWGLRAVYVKVFRGLLPGRQWTVAHEVDLVGSKIRIPEEETK